MATKYVGFSHIHTVSPLCTIYLKSKNIYGFLENGMSSQIATIVLTLEIG